MSETIFKTGNVTENIYSCVWWIQSEHDGVFPVHFLYTQACLWWWWWWWGEGGYRNTHTGVCVCVCIPQFHDWDLHSPQRKSRITFISLGTLHTCCKNSDTRISLQALSNPAQSFHLCTFINPATKQFLWKKRQTCCCVQVTARTDL